MGMSKYLPWLLLFTCASAQAVPDIRHWQSDRGAGVYFVETRELPMVDIQVIFAAGSSRDGNSPGLAKLTNSLLAEGAGGLSADAISRGFEDLGAVYGFDAGRDSATVSLRSLSDPELLKPALENFRRVITAPDFPEDAFRRQRDRALTAIREKQQSPDDLASDAFYAALYGEHPYAFPSEGTEDSLQNISRSDVATFHGRFYTARNAVIAIVGDLDRDDAAALVNELLADLPPGEKAPPLPDVPRLAGAKTIMVDHPSTQTHILVGQPGIRRGDPDFFPLLVGNHVLGGGGMVSLLFREIREKRGLSYSAYSYFLPMFRPGPFVAGLQTRTDQAEAAVELLHDQLQSYLERGPAEAELMAAKKNISGGFPLRIDSNSDIVANLALIGFYNLPLDYLETYVRNVEEVTADQVREAFRRHLFLDRLVTVLVGPQTRGERH